MEYNLHTQVVRNKVYVKQFKVNNGSILRITDARIIVLTLLHKEIFRLRATWLLLVCWIKMLKYVFYEYNPVKELINSLKAEIV